MSSRRVERTAAEPGARLAMRRLALLAACLITSVALTITLGPGALWPLFLPPLLVATLFFWEGGAAVASLCAAGCAAYLAVAGRGMESHDAVLGVALYLAAGVALGVLFRRQRRAHARLASSALTDRLTGLYNYATFADFLHTEVCMVQRYGGRLTLVMLDLDHFKRFNDMHGHQAGNDLLRDLGATLKGLLRGADLVARYGGEEFAILIRGDELDGLRLAERVRRAVLTLPVRVPGGEAYVTLSAGVACYPADAASETELIELADAALYESKRHGRNCVSGCSLGSMEHGQDRRHLRLIGA